MIKGFDVSHLENPIPWQNVSPDFKFVYAKATQGATYKDPYFNEVWQHLKTTTLYRGAYIFWSCTTTAQQHWDNINSLGIGWNKPGVLPLMLDLENQATPELDKWVANNHTACVQSITDLLNLIKVNTGRDAVIYSYKSYFSDYLGGASWPNNKLWLAAYQSQPPGIPKGWGNYTIWQASEYGTYAGGLTGGNLDIDLFNGSAEDLAILANIKDTRNQQ